MQLGEESYQAWLNQPPIQFPLPPSLPIRNAYSDKNSSHVGNGGNELDVGMDGLLQQRISRCNVVSYILGQ